MRSGSLRFGLVVACALTLFAGRARADIVLYDKDGWGFFTRGDAAAFYQLALGDADPQPTGAPQIGGLLSTAVLSNQRTNTVTLSRLRSGFVGTQIGFGIRRDISDTVHVDSLMAVSLQDVSGGQSTTALEGVDFREAWASLVTPYGSFKFGRMFSIFGSASAQVVLLAYRYGIGNPCVAGGAGIACGSVGAGPLYAGFNAEMRYVTPRLAGFEGQVSVGDPISGQASSFTLTPLPRFDAEINYDKQFGEVTRLRVIAQGVTQEIQRNNMGPNGDTLESRNIWGAMGSAIFEAGGFAVGAGLWEGAGIGTTRLLEVPSGSDSISFDPTGELRLFRGYFGNIAYDYHGSRLAAGTGIVYVRPTAQDSGPAPADDPLDHAGEWHVVFTQQFDTFILTAEYARWVTRWHDDSHETMNFVSGGATFNW
jgi:porin-like protein